VLIVEHFEDITLEFKGDTFSQISNVNHDKVPPGIVID
jgi:hypothetical protein